MRLNAYLARAGVASRRKADELIRTGRVRVNGAPGELNTLVGARDVVELDGERVERQDTTGALLLTNDGALAHRLAHPRYLVPKVYEAEVEGVPSRNAVARLRAGVELEDGVTAPAQVRALAPGRLELTLHEGRKHQVKRMCEAVGHPVRRLHRARYAGLDLEGLAPGSWRALDRDEVASLRSEVGL